jgi:selenocysteine lyase/cysteine desulfurase
VGVNNIAAELLRKRNWLVPALRAKGYDALCSDVPAESSSCIVSFFRSGKDLTPLHQKLLEANVITSLRTDRSGQKYIRLSPHFYNTDSELHRALDLL